MERGLIALDIDGTLTSEWHTLPEDVEAYLHTLYNQGWSIAIFTGRPYLWAEPIIKKFTFPLYVGLQNGAIILKMPEEKIVKRHYFPKGSLADLDKICSKHKTSFVIYAGIEYENQCFYRPHLFSEKERTYLQTRFSGLEERYVPMDSFDTLQGLEFPSYKCFGSHEKMSALAEEVRSTLGWHIPVITDRFDTNYFVAQMTREGIDKGSALLDCKKLANIQGTVIAAGDDHNDFEMLMRADQKVVMKTAPPELLAIADVIAPSAEDSGIIEGLKKCVSKS